MDTHHSICLLLLLTVAFNLFSGVCMCMIIIIIIVLSTKLVKFLHNNKSMIWIRTGDNEPNRFSVLLLFLESRCCKSIVYHLLQGLTKSHNISSYAVTRNLYTDGALRYPTMAFSQMNELKYIPVGSWYCGQLFGKSGYTPTNCEGRYEQKQIQPIAKNIGLIKPKVRPGII